MRPLIKNISLVLVAFACLLPVIILIALSLSQNWAYPSFLPKTFTAEAWHYIFQRGNNIGSSIVTSFIIAFTVALLSTFAGFFTSRFISYHKHRNRLLFLAYLPFILSPVILALCLKYYFIRLHISGTIAGVILAQLIIAFPYSTIVLSSFWNERIQQYHFLVQTLGGSNRQAFAKVIYPIATPILLVCFFQCFLISWFEYGLTLVIGFGRVQTLTLRVSQFLTEANIFYAALSCCLLIIPPTILLWTNKRFVFHKID
jgi:putative spermidine/putrescine transport system permease protein